MVAFDLNYSGAAIQYELIILSCFNEMYAHTLELSTQKDLINFVNFLNAI